jgi:hypothetical protein
MRIPLLAALLAATCATGCMTGGPSTTRAAESSAALGKALAGRKPGAPTSCINLHDIRSSRIIDETAIIYEVSSRRWYVNRPPGGCSGLKPGRTIVSRTPSTSLCSGDIIRIIDPPSPVEYGACGLGQFTPYEK